MDRMKSIFIFNIQKKNHGFFLRSSINKKGVICTKTFYEAIFFGLMTTFDHIFGLKGTT